MDRDLRALLDSATVEATAVDGQDVLLLRVGKGTAPAVWQRLRDAHGETGLWPFLADADVVKEYDQPTVWDHLEQGSDDEAARGAEEILSTPPEIDEDDEEEYLANLTAGAPDLSGPPEAWELTQEEGETTNIGLARTEAGGWDIPRLLRWDGAATRDISGAEHSNVLKYWHERYGTELVVATSNVLGLFVANPPTERAEVEAVAREQYHYCADIVTQDYGTLAVLAAERVHSHHWYFWWV